MDVRRSHTGGKTCHDLPVDRALLADVAQLVRHLDGYDGVYDLGERAAVVISDDISRARAAARLTALGGIDVNIVSSPISCRGGSLVALSSDDFAAAVERDEKRRAAWNRFLLQGAERVGPTTVYIVSVRPATIAAVLHARASRAISTYGTSTPSAVMEMLAVFALPNVIVLDASLEGMDDLDRQIRTLYPSRFGGNRVQWIASRVGFLDDEIARILRALGVRMQPGITRTWRFTGIRIIVIGDNDLAREVSAAAQGAEVIVVTGWEAIDRLAEGNVDIIVAGEVTDFALPSLVRIARSSKSPPQIVIANDEPKSTRMRSAYPHIAHYFVDRPVRMDDLLRAVRS